MRSPLPAPDEIWQQQFKQRLIQAIADFPHDSFFYLGCSGGMDSMLLLSVLSEIIPQRLHVLSVDHQLQTQSTIWSAMVADYCQQLNVPCTVIPVKVSSGNLEAAARQARYKAFEQYLSQDDVLILAHHQQDQAETVMLRLLQGAGVGGLSAMRMIDTRQQFTQDSQYFLWRPLLQTSRQKIEAFIHNQKVPYVDDPMNHDPHYDRVWCRHLLWPVLMERFPAMQDGISRTAQLMQDADDILADVLQQDWQSCVSDQADCLKLTQLNLLSAPRQRQLLSRWMQGSGIYRPAFSMVERLQHEVIAARQDASSILHVGDYYFTRFADHLYRYSSLQWQNFIQPLTVQDIVFEQQVLSKIALGQVKPVLERSVGLDTVLIGKKLTLLPRQGGEKIMLYNRPGHRVLKKLLQDAKIAPWFRHQIQILMYHNTLLGVFTPQGFWLAQSPFVKNNGWLPLIQA